MPYGRAPQVDGSVAECPSHLIEVGYRVISQIVRHVDPLLDQIGVALGQGGQLQLWIELTGQIGNAFGRRTGERCRMAGAALVDEKDVAGTVQFAEERHHDACH